MYKRKILQIVPKIDSCGVGDYAQRIGELLSKDMEVSYLATSNQGRRISIDGLSQHLKTWNARDGKPTIVLQFSGYGYARWGLCWGLVVALRGFLRKNPDCQLITMFHELWANSWAQPAQRWIVKSLCAISSKVRTNRQDSADLLRRFWRHEEVNVMPVPSNLGECIQLPDWHAKTPQIVMFQPPSAKTSAGSHFWKSWECAQSFLGDLPTFVAGQSSDLPDDTRIKVMGFLQVSEASRLLSCSQFSFSSYAPRYYAKSSIFAALAAHATTCILPDDANSDADGLFKGYHYLTTEQLRSHTPHQMAAIAGNVWHWYEPHSIQKNADSFREAITC